MAVAALACSWISLPPPAFVPVAAGIALAWAWHGAQALQLGGSAARSLELNAQGGARCQDGLGQWHDAEILPGSYVSNWLMVVMLRAAAGAARWWCCRCFHFRELRRLRVWLRWRLGRP